MTVIRLSTSGIAATAAMLAFTAVGCASSDGQAADVSIGADIPSSTVRVDEPNAAPDIEQTCAELQVVQDFSEQMATATTDILRGVVEAGGDASEEDTVGAFIALAEEIDVLLPDLLAAYERAAATAPPDIAAEIRAVADGTAVLTPPLVEAYREVDSAADLADLEGIFATPELEEAARSAGISSLRLDNFTNPNCGFQFSNS